MERSKVLNETTEFLARIDRELVECDTHRSLLDADLQQRLQESVFPQIEDGNGPGWWWKDESELWDNHEVNDPCDCKGKIPSHRSCNNGTWGNGKSCSFRLRGPLSDDEFEYELWRVNSFFGIDVGDENETSFPDLYKKGD